MVSVAVCLVYYLLYSFMHINDNKVQPAYIGVAKVSVVALLWVKSLRGLGTISFKNQVWKKSTLL